MLTAAVFVLFLLAVFLLLAHKNGRCPFGMPGPWRLPYVGCMYLFKWSSQPHKTLASLANVYGNVYCLRLGMSDVVVLNSTAAVKEALFHRGDDFAGRPTLFSLGLWSNNTSESMQLMDFCPYFLRHKYAAEMSMRDLLNDATTLIVRTSNALDSLTARFEPFLNNNVILLNPREPILDSIADFVMDNVFGQTIGRWFYHEAHAVLEQSLSYADTAYVGNCMDFVPIMRIIQTKQIRKTMSDTSRLHEFISKVFDVHKASMLDTEDYNSSLVQHLCRTKDNVASSHCPFLYVPGDSLGLDEGAIVSLITDIIFNAYVKLSSTLRWCVARLAENPAIQRDLQAQLDQLVLGEARLSLDDKARIPLLEAFILETLRTTCVFPLGLPRKTVRETVICGLTIPKDISVFINLWSCANDPKVYSEPEQFNPSRFLTKASSGKPTVKSSSFPTFSAGSRKCPGDTFSKNVLFLLTGGLLQNYTIELENPKLKSNLEGKYGLSLRPKEHKIRVRKRVQLSIPDTTMYADIDGALNLYQS